MSENKTPNNRAQRKKTVAVWNRRLAWVTLPIFLTSTGTYYLAKFGFYPNLMPLSGISSLVFILFFFTHTAFSVYLFGFPKFRRNVRVVHIYIGYGLFIFTLVSQSIIHLEPYHLIAYSIMWLFLIAHVALSTRFMLKRNYQKQPDRELSFYTGGSLLRDATAGAERQKVKGKR